MGSQPPADTAPKKPAPAQASRPSSRASQKRPTGRPRGRPRKKPLETGNTSAAEEATDADDGPNRKRAKVTQVDYNSVAPFGSTTDSLRVAASTSGALRNMRPMGAAGGAQPASHLQDVPRAPTPVPDASALQKKQRKRAPVMAARRESMAEFENCGPYPPHFSQQSTQMTMHHDARSPTDSIAQSPDQGYTPESAPDLGSSPPVPRATAYMHSSPMPSSPVLPPMPMPPVDSGFMSGGVDDFFDEEELPQELPQELPRRNSHVDAFQAPPTKQAAKQAAARKARNSPNFPFQEVNPGPPELLPVTSIFNPAGRARSLNRNIAPKKIAPKTLKRSNTTSGPPPSEPEPVHQDEATRKYSFQSVQSTAPHDPIYNRPASQPEMGTQQVDGSFINMNPEAAPMPQAPIQEAQAEKPVAAPSPKEILPKPELPVPASNPVHTAPTPNEPQQLPPRPSSRPASRGPVAAPIIPASDPAPEMVTLTLPPVSYSEAPCPPPENEEPPRFNKNFVKKQSIKERLESAIQRGEMPPYCNNCGAIETPTWRKIWTQDHKGVPDFYELSDKPGHVTTIDILERDAEGQPTMHRLVKKALGSSDNRGNWAESLLCNRKFHSRPVPVTSTKRKS